MGLKELLPVILVANVGGNIIGKLPYRSFSDKLELTSSKARCKIGILLGKFVPELLGMVSVNQFLDRLLSRGTGY